jgi:hypothetical protein
VRTPEMALSRHTNHTIYYEPFRAFIASLHQYTRHEQHVLGVRIIQTITLLVSPFARQFSHHIGKFHMKSSVPSSKLWKLCWPPSTPSPKGAIAGSKGSASQSSSGIKFVTFSARLERLDWPALWLFRKSMPMVVPLRSADVARDGRRGGREETTKLSRRRATCRSRRVA